MNTVGDIFLSRAGDPRPALYFENQCWSGNELVSECTRRANYLIEHSGSGPCNVGLLMDNIPEHVFWIGACALAGSIVVAINATRKGEDLARDVTHTECRFLVVESKYLENIPVKLVQALGHRLLLVDTAQAKDWQKQALPLLITHSKISRQGSDIFCLIFTSGTSGAPKAVIYSQQRTLYNSRASAENMGFSSDSVSYVAMPLFHSTALLMGLLPVIYSGGAAVLRRKFSASGFLNDVRRYGVTMFAYVGKPLAYILATPEGPQDADNTLRLAVGSEASDVDIANFSRRFGCHVIDNYGSSEGCIVILRTPDTPRGSIGKAASDDVAVFNPESGKECPCAVFDEHGRLRNGNDAIGELVSLNGAASFEGYWRNAEAEAGRIREGVYWSGDLAYRDEDGFFYFAGRSNDWLRVDGENIATTQIEQLLCRYPAITCAAAYGVPDPLVGDRIMVAVQLKDGAKLDATDLDHFMLAQADFCSKWMPSFLRISQELPVTQTNKILKRTLKSEAWLCNDPIYWKPGPKDSFRSLTRQDITKLKQVFVERKRDHLLPAGN